MDREPLRVAADGSLIAQTPPAQNTGAATNGSSSSSDRAERDEPARTNTTVMPPATATTARSGTSTNTAARAAHPTTTTPAAAGAGSGDALRDHLSAQLRVTQAGPRDRALVMFLIESLDDDGYLTATLDEVLADLPPELEIDCDELNAALALLHSFDPAGVGARSASECLKLQLLRLDPSPTRTLALEIVSQHLELLAARDSRGCAST